MARKTTEGGLDAALRRLEEVYVSTDMDEAEYRRRKTAITNKYLDEPSGGLIERASHGDRAAVGRLGFRAAATAAVVLVLAVVGCGAAAVLAPDSVSIPSVPTQGDDDFEFEGDD